MYLSEYEELDGIGRSLKRAVRKVTRPVAKIARIATKPARMIVRPVSKLARRSGISRALSLVNPVIAANVFAAARKKGKRVVPAVESERTALTPFGYADSPVSAPAASIPQQDYDNNVMTQEERDAYILDAAPRDEVQASGYVPSPEQRNEPDVPSMVQPGDESAPPAKKKLPLPVIGLALLALNFF